MNIYSFIHIICNLFCFFRRDKLFDIGPMISKPFLALEKYLKESKRVAYDANKTV